MSPHRHQDMDVVRKRLLAEYYFFCQHLKYIDPEHAETYFTLLENRFTDKPVLRGYYVDLMNRHIEEEAGAPVDLPEVAKSKVLPFVSEVLMTIMYYDNQILDKKAGVTTSEKINHNLLQGSILLSELYHYIETRVDDELLAYQIVKMTREVYEVVCIGQEIEIKYNHIEAWKSNSFEIEGYNNLPFNEAVIAQVKESIQKGIEFPKEKVGFIDAYARRIYLTNAYLFERFIAFFLDRSGLEKNIKNNLSQLAGLSGILVQMVNDNTDLVPECQNKGTKNRNSEDAFSDLKNGNITLPIAFHIISSKISISQYLFDFENELITDFGTCERMIESSAIQNSIKTSLNLKQKVGVLVNINNDFQSLVKDSLSMVNGNRFYSVIKRMVLEKKGIKDEEGNTEESKLFPPQIFDEVSGSILLNDWSVDTNSKIHQVSNLNKLGNWISVCHINQSHLQSFNA